MDFKCKCCEKITTADDFDAIVATGKLCNYCFNLDEDGREKVRKAIYAKTHTLNKQDLSRKKPTKIKNKRKLKSKKMYTFVCNNCGLDSKLDFKPHMCDGENCKSQSFFRKSV